MRWLALLTVVVALVATTGCGGGSNESAASTETTTTESTTTESTTTETSTAAGETSTESTGATDVSPLASEDCLALAGAGATIAAAFSGANGDTQGAKELESLANKVPDDIKADVQTLAAAFSEYGQKLKDIGITTGKTPSASQLQQLQAAIQSLDQQKLTAASNHIEAWAKTNCQS